MENENRRYILTLGYALRGWKLLPYAIQYLYAPRTEFFREDDWALISACGGCRAIAVRDHPTDYLAKDLIACEYFKGGWKDKKDALLRSIGQL